MESDGAAGASRVSELMAAFRRGDPGAAGELFEIFHPQLKRLATAQMGREREAHSWQPTALVNELYLQLIKIRALKPPETDAGNDRAAFLSLAALLMKRLLIHHSRPLSRKAAKVEVEEDILTETPGFESLADVDDVLARLEGIRPRLRTIVELRVFEGLTGDEIAERLECGPATVAREWNFAKHWLQKQWMLAHDRMSPGSEVSSSK